MTEARQQELLKKLNDILEVLKETRRQAEQIVTNCKKYLANEATESRAS